MLSIAESAYDERGTPGLAFVVENTGSLPIYSLDVQVLPRPFNNVTHSTQLLHPVAPGGVDTLDVPLTTRRSHNDYECYEYILSGSDDDPETRRVNLYREEPGTCG